MRLPWLRGHTVSVLDGEHNRSTIVTVLDEKIAISLCSKQTRKDHELTVEEKQRLAKGWSSGIPKCDYLASEQLALNIVGGPGDEYPRSVSDTGRRLIENQVNKFVGSLLRAAEAAKAARVEEKRQILARQEADLHRREAERHQQEAVQRRKTEEQFLKWLLAEVNGWITAENIRAYLRVMRKTALERYGSIHPESQLAQWLEWAEQQADRQDPLMRTPKSPMDHERPYGFGYSQDKFEFLRIENNLFLNPANAVAPVVETSANTPKCPQGEKDSTGEATISV